MSDAEKFKESPEDDRISKTKTAKQGVHRAVT